MATTNSSAIVPFVRNFEQSLRHHERKTVRLEFVLEAVCGALASTSRGRLLLVVRAGLRTCLASAVASRALE